MIKGQVEQVKQALEMRVKPGLPGKLAAIRRQALILPTRMVQPQAQVLWADQQLDCLEVQPPLTPHRQVLELQVQVAVVVDPKVLQEQYLVRSLLEASPMFLI